MKIVTKTPEELILESRPWGLGIGVIVAFLVIVFVVMNVIAQGNVMAGIAILLIGSAVCLGISWAFVRFEDVRFSKPDGAVQIRSRSLFGKAQNDIPLSAVQCATIETSISKTQVEKKSGHGRTTKTTTTYRPSLLMLEKGAAKVPLVAVYNSNDKPAKETVNAVNQWLAQRSA